jgi:hypothetical protein
VPEFKFGDHLEPVIFAHRAMGTVFDPIIAWVRATQALGTGTLKSLFGKTTGRAPKCKSTACAGWLTPGPGSLADDDNVIALDECVKAFGQTCVDGKLNRHGPSVAKALRHDPSQRLGAKRQPKSADSGKSRCVFIHIAYIDGSYRNFFKGNP